MKKDSLLQNSLHLIVFIIAFCTVLSLISCCSDDSGLYTKPVGEDIRSELYIDVDKVSDVNVMILNSKIEGNEAASDALFAVKRINRGKYEQQGNLAKGKHDYKEAVKNYDRALSWGTEYDFGFGPSGKGWSWRPPAKGSVVDLNRKIAESYAEMAERAQENPPKGEDSRADYYRSAYRYMDSAATNTVDNNERALNYLLAANYGKKAGVGSRDVCSALNSAFLDATDQKLLDQIKEAKRRASCK